MSDDRLKELAEAAGLVLEWQDSEGRTQYLAPDVQRTLLPLLGFGVDTDEAVKKGLERLRCQKKPASPAQLPPLVTADQGVAVRLPCPLLPGTAYTLALENGETRHSRVGSGGDIEPVTLHGYHRLEIQGARVTLAVAPPRCYSVADASGREKPRLWGLAAQLYSLRRTGDGGFGDLQALTSFCRSAAQTGADAVAISPTHAMFVANPAHYGPYSPSSRLFHNALYCAPEQVLGEAMVSAAIQRCNLAQRLEDLENLPLIDWPGAGRTKLILLRELYEDFVASLSPDMDALREQLAEFRCKGGSMLEDHCRFEALMAAQDAHDWRQWPLDLRDPRSDVVERFARSNAHEVRYYAFLQWLASEGLSRAQVSAREAGMKVGLIADLAVGTDHGGSQTWSRKEEMLEGLSIGAPPDAFNVHGQDWGLCSFSPHGLVQSGFRSFIDMLRGNLAHAGGLRIDHILGFLRLWLVPHGKGPKQGGYVRFPLKDLLRLVALESVRHRAIVVGEDLGTVAPGFSEQLAERGIMGMNVLWFERDDDGEFLAPEQWSANAMAMTSTHDLPTVAGWWVGRDVEWRGGMGLLPESQTLEDAREERRKERVQLAHRLGLSIHLGEERFRASDFGASQVLQGCARHLGQTASPLAILPVEDALGLEEQANLPGTLTEHPNWRRRWSPEAAAMLMPEEVRHRLRTLHEARTEFERKTKNRHSRVYRS
ncbi:MAG: 4-alpha-glucanotransferase [Oleiphilaceae bacterium]|nr:4-alpha-glucanotransferase [Oleiphilaceae bacterium]